MGNNIDERLSMLALTYVQGLEAAHFRNMIEDISALDENRLKALQQFLQAFGNK